VVREAAAKRERRAPTEPRRRTPRSGPETTLAERAGASLHGEAASAPSWAGPAVSVAGPSVGSLDPLVHDRARLGILSALAVNESLGFSDLKRLLSTTDGNLSVHARKLEEAGLLACAKSFAGRVPRSEYRITRAGRRALERYLEHMEALIRATRR
jgi:DNA-binding HxlR family transcriptional regulator